MARDQLPRRFTCCLVVFSAVQRSLFCFLVVTLHFGLSQFDGLRLNNATELFGCDRAIARANFHSSMIPCGGLRLPQFAS
jgi:hypothetical protein